MHTSTHEIIFQRFRQAIQMMETNRPPSRARYFFYSTRSLAEMYSFRNNRFCVLHTLDNVNSAALVVQVYTWISLSLYLYIYMYTYIHIYVYLYTHLQICIHIMYHLSVLNLCCYSCSIFQVCVQYVSLCVIFLGLCIIFVRLCNLSGYTVWGLCIIFWRFVQNLPSCFSN